VSPKPMSKVVLAAGGIVWRKTRQGPEVLVIRRSRHEDWSLPKGKVKLDKGETCLEAALREVKEETGLEPEIADFADAINYVAKGEQKLVLFWNMLAEKLSPFRPSEEVQELKWLEPCEAIEILSYNEQKEALEKSYMDMKWKDRCFRRLIRSIKLPRTGGSMRRERLKASIEVLRTKLQCREKLVPKKHVDNTQWIDTARRYLHKATCALYRGKTNEAWRYLHAAEQMEVFGLQEAELSTRAKILHVESEEKLRSWRKQAASFLLHPENWEKKTEVTKIRLYLATLIRDENADNQYFRIELLQGQMAILVIILGIILIGLFLAAILNVIPFHSDQMFFNWKMLLSVMIFGWLGGTVSAIFSLARTSIKRRIPEHIANIPVTLVRTGVGAASAAAIYIFLASNIIDVHGLNTPKILFFSFAAGFSEYLLKKAVESVAGKENQS